MESIGFYIGHENSVPKANLLYRSLCENTAFADKCRIVAMVPDGLRAQSVFEMPTVRFKVPESCRRIPFADKMLAAAEFENRSPGEYLWLDADSFFFRDVRFPQKAKICVNPVDMRNIGVRYSDKLGPLWELLFGYYGLEPACAGSVTTGITRERIYPYYNVGMVRIKESKGVFSETGEVLRRLLALEDIKRLLDSSPLIRIFLHQAVFSCAVLKMYGDGIRALPYGTNYPLHLHDKDPSPIPFEDVVSIRYDDYFDRHRAPAIWDSIFNGMENELKSCWYYPDW